MHTAMEVTNSKHMRQAYSRLAAGTSVVTLMDESGVKMGLTVSAVTSVSLEPPLMLVCINSLSRVIAPMERGTPFVINLLAQEQASLGMQFAMRDGDKFAGVETRLTAGGALALTGTLAAFECVPHELIPAGDHVVVIGRVVNVDIGSDGQPLVFYRSTFLTL